jgi:hypothetical protein
MSVSSLIWAGCRKAIVPGWKDLIGAAIIYGALHYLKVAGPPAQDAATLRLVAASFVLAYAFRRACWLMCLVLAARRAAKGVGRLASILKPR